jgi:hypothetical protein
MQNSYHVKRTVNQKEEKLADVREFFIWRNICRIGTVFRRVRKMLPSFAELINFHKIGYKKHFLKISTKQTFWDNFRSMKKFLKQHLQI